MRYESNLGNVIDNLNVKLKKVKNTDPILREIAVSLSTSNNNRIHNDGRNLLGGNIGEYAESTKRIRRKKGRQVSKVDLSFTGKLSKEFQPQEISGGWGVGFLTSYGGNLFKKLTAQYGDLWGISRSDQQAIKKISERKIKKNLG